MTLDRIFIQHSWSLMILHCNKNIQTRRLAQEIPASPRERAPHILPALVFLSAVILLCFERECSSTNISSSTTGGKLPKQFEVGWGKGQEPVSQALPLERSPYGTLYHVKPQSCYVSKYSQFLQDNCVCEGTWKTKCYISVQFLQKTFFFFFYTCFQCYLET